MDIASFLGIVVGISLIVLAIRKDLNIFISIPSAMITFGGAIAATFINFPFTHVMKVLKVASKVFFAKPLNPYDTVEKIVALAEKARREGFLALESEISTIKDDFLKRGLQSVIDGVSREAIKDNLTKQLDFLSERHALGQEIFNSMGTYAPAFGMIGTLIGLILMLNNLDDPKKVGPGMALAIITTLYGALASYLVFLPIAGKLRVRDDEERLVKEVCIEGILSLHAGEAPRMIREKLYAYLAPRVRELERKKAQSPREIAQEPKKKKK
ncbi:MAG: motility protein A [Candidatus Omnitrophica bacterium]|nr:motility protein A [Candidatus Omnitrophota bacterium]